MRTPEAEMVAESFGLARPVGRLEPWAHSTFPTWTLDTADGRVLVKGLDAGRWRDSFVRAMEVERLALGAGVRAARPLLPVVPAVGFGVDVGRGELLRAYEWIDGRGLDDADDVAEWLGGTLARLHGLERAGREGPEWYHLNDAALWTSWLAEGERQQRTWAPALRRHLPAVLDACAWVERGFDAAGDYVSTHRDVEPWNVLMTASGPVLVDWDSAGPDSARLELAHAAVVFARRGRHTPEPDAVRRTVRAYAEQGGTPPPAEPDVMVRRVAILLGRLAERLRMSLGEQPLGPHERDRIEAVAGERITTLAGFAEEVRGWAPLLTR